VARTHPPIPRTWKPRFDAVASRIAHFAYAQTFSSRRYNFDWRGFISPGVNLIVLICPGVFLLQTLANLLLREFADRQGVLFLICGGI
jgi:hypothetical protein